jgi:hypothetical protein
VPHYDTAAICRRGHVFTAHVERAERIPPYCRDCGTEILSACPECNGAIRGQASNVSGGNYHKPDFCEECASPFPWLSRRGAIQRLRTLLDDADLDQGTRLQVSEELQALAEPDLSDDEQRERWKTVRRLAPTVWDGGQKIIVNIISEALKKSLGL